MQTISKLTPEKVWKYFSDILTIPRPSKKEEKIILYLINFAKENNLSYKKDQTGNILISKTATKGFEKRKTIILQSHVDMVCEQNDDGHHNFNTDPIVAYIEDGWIKAKGTTLGADNGIGIAIQLAILADKKIEHGPLECLFTVDEESGMTGALGLDEAFLSGDILINLDSEDEGELFIGCAGGIDTLINIPFTHQLLQGNNKTLIVRVKGLLGGHSGDDISKARGNAIKILSRLLWNTAQQTEISLCNIKGGNLRNAIPREATAYISMKAEKTEKAIFSIRQQADIIKSEFTMEPNLTIDIVESAEINTSIDSATQKSVLNCLHACPNGVIEMSADISGLVETSSNMASVNTLEQGELAIVTSQRSSVESAKDNIASRIRSLFELANARIVHTDSYPGWNPNPDSEILHITAQSYKELFNIHPKVKAIHAGLECGLFLKKNPNLDMVSIGPTIKGAHSPDERMDINSVNKFWRLLIHILKNISVK